MTRGMSHCRICGKRIPSIYRQNHERYRCLRMRKLRGDSDILMRELPKVEPIEEQVEPGQQRLLSFLIT